MQGSEIVQINLIMNFLLLHMVAINKMYEAHHNPSGRLYLTQSEMNNHEVLFLA